jgi:hypothetical protein
MKCPSCGTDAGSARFCPNCGTSLAERTCSACGARLSPRAKFCPDCGKVIAAGGVAAPAGQPGAAPALLPWVVAGAAIVIAAAAVIIAVTKQGSPASTANAPFAGSGTGAATTDLSTMTPRQQADRLFDRVMRASTANDTGQVAFFGPMAINAYANVAPLDADARLHVGMIQLVLANPAGAMAQGDSLVRESPTHLFGPLLQARSAEQSGNTQPMRDAYRRFLARYDAEMAKQLDEYLAHRADLEAARTTAQGLR